MSAKAFSRHQILAEAAKKLSSRRSFDPSKHSQPRYSQIFERAAVLSSFSVDELSGDADDTEVNNLLDLSRPVFDGDSQRWVLEQSTRKGVLKQLSSVDKIQETLNAITSSQPDPLLTTIGDMVEGKLTVETDDLTQLSRLWSVRQLFAEEADGMPAPASITRRIEFLNFIKPFQDLVGKNFKGREKELARLADYVGVLGASSYIESVTRAFRQVFSLREKPPLMLFGPGGVGKSSLIARFILDHAEALKEGRLPFTYIDFDRRQFSPEQPLTIFYEALNQLIIQFPEYAKTLSGLRNSWRAAVTQTSQPGKAKTQNKDQYVAKDLLPRMIQEFGKTLKAIGLDQRPYLLFLDTLEKVRFRDRASFGRFWRYIDMLQDAHPYLRLIVSGRAPIGGDPDDAADDESEFDLKTEKMLLGGLSTGLVTEYLAENGFPAEFAKQAAKRMNADNEGIGISPLSMKVAAAVWKQRMGEGGAEVLDEQFWSELQAGRIQDQLITRYLDHIEDPDVQRVAGPALLLRVIDAAIVRDVLAAPFKVVLESDEDALELFEKLRDAIDMFSSKHEDAVQIYPRAEVREALLRLMLDLDRDKVSEVHGLAIDYYATLSDGADPVQQPALRAEEIYHRLARGGDEETIRKRWNLPGIGDFLAGAEAELPIQSQALLLSLLGDRVPGEMQRAASLATWESDARHRARNAKTIDEKLAILRERSKRSPGSRLYADEAALLLEKGNTEEACSIANRGLESMPPTARSAYRIDLQVVSAKIAWALDQYDAALEHLSQAQRIAIDREDAGKSLEIALLSYEWASSRDDEARAADFQNKLIHAVLVMSTEQLISNVDLVGRVIVDIAEPRVIMAGIRGGVLETMPVSSRRKLARAMSEYDQRVSKDQGEPAGVILRYASLPQPESLTDAWKGLFIDLITLVPDILNSVFSRFAFADATEFLDTLVSELRRAQDKPRKKKSADAGRSTKSWWSGAIGSGRRVTDTGRAFAARFSIDELRMIVLTLGRSLESIVSLSEPMDRLVYTLVMTANREGWLEELVVKAAEYLPADGGLLKLANAFDTGFLSVDFKEVSRLLRAADGAEEIDLYSQIASVGRWICRVDIDEKARGTGLLVGPDLVLTSFSVVQDPEQTLMPSDISFVFDYVEPDEQAGGQTFNAQNVQFVDFSGYNDNDAIDAENLGYVLIRVEGHPGDEPVFDPGPGLAEFNSVKRSSPRGWIDLTGILALPNVDEQLLVMHHPLGERLHIGLSSRGIQDVEREAPIIRYRVDTQPGTAGAPCFNTNMQIVAMHQGTDGNLSFGTSMQAIVDAMRQKGSLEYVGLALA